MTNKETKSLRKSLAPALDKIHEVTEVPDTPVPDDEKEGSFVTSPTRRRNSKSKGAALPIANFCTAEIEIPYTPSKLPGDTLYGSLEHQLKMVELLQKKGSTSDDGGEASKDSDSGDSDEGLKLGSSGSTLEPGQLLQLSDDSITLYNLSDNSISPDKGDNNEDPETEDSEDSEANSDDNESDVSKEFNTLAEATLKDVSPKSVSKLVN